MQARSTGKRVCKRASLISAWESISNYASSRRNSGIKVRSITCECLPMAQQHRLGHSRIPHGRLRTREEVMRLAPGKFIASLKEASR